MPSITLDGKSLCYFSTQINQIIFSAKFFGAGIKLGKRLSPKSIKFQVVSILAFKPWTTKLLKSLKTKKPNAALTNNQKPLLPFYLLPYVSPEFLPSLMV